VGQFAAWRAGAAAAETLLLLLKLLLLLLLTWGSNGEACLNNVHTQLRQLPGNVQLFLAGKGCTRRLLSVTQGGVKDTDIVGVVNPAATAVPTAAATDTA
jgi:hypothetical protein